MHWFSIATLCCCLQCPKLKHGIWEHRGSWVIKITASIYNIEDLNKYISELIHIFLSDRYHMYNFLHLNLIEEKNSMYTEI